MGTDPSPQTSGRWSRALARAEAQLERNRAWIDRRHQRLTHSTPVTYDPKVHVSTKWARTKAGPVQVINPEGEVETLPAYRDRERARVVKDGRKEARRQRKARNSGVG